MSICDFGVHVTMRGTALDTFPAQVYEGPGAAVWVQPKIVQTQRVCVFRPPFVVCE